MKRYLSLLLVIGSLLVPMISLADSNHGTSVTSTVVRTVIPRSLPKIEKYEPTQAPAQIFILRKGITDPAVLLLQGSLSRLGFDPGTLDGKFGKQTEVALRSLQSSSGGELSIDGVAGPRTLLYIERRLKEPVSETSNLASIPTPPASSSGGKVALKTIPSLPYNVLKQALKAPTLLSTELSLDGTRKFTSKPKLIVTPGGFTSVGIFVVAPGGVNPDNTVANLNTNFSSGAAGKANKVYICGTKDGVKKCIAVTPEEAAQIENGTSDADQILSGANGQSGECPSFYVDGDAPLISNEPLEDGCQNTDNIALTVCLGGTEYTTETGLSTGKSCSSPSEIVDVDDLDPGVATCYQGMNFNPITGAPCGAIPHNAPLSHIDERPLTCLSGAVYNPFTGALCAQNASIDPTGWRNTLAAYAFDKLTTFNKGTTGKNVDIAQRLLANYGFIETSSQTSYAGDKTEQGIKNFEKAVGLPQTGKVSGQTLAFMKAALFEDSSLANMEKATAPVSKTAITQKLSSLVAKYPAGVKGSSYQVANTVQPGSSDAYTYQSGINPENGGEGTIDQRGQITCIKKDTTTWADGKYTVKVYIGVVGHALYPKGTVKLTYKGAGDAATEVHPKLNLIAAKGLNAMLFSYTTKTGDNILPGSYNFDENPIFEVEGADNMRTLSNDFKKHYLFNWDGLNQPQPICDIEVGGNGFRGVVGGNGSIYSQDQIDNWVNLFPPPTPATPTPVPPPACFNGIKDLGESAIDQGGPCGSGPPPPPPPPDPTGGTTPTVSGNCFDGVQNQDETGIDSGGSCTHGTGVTTTGGANPPVDNDGAPCPTSLPCHEWHGVRWFGNYPINLTVDNYMATPQGNLALVRSNDDWNLFPRVNFQVVGASGQPPVGPDGYCHGTGNHIPICEVNLNDGALGVASISADPNTGEIMGCGVSINRKYLDQSEHSHQAWWNMVVSQEMGHCLAVLHHTTNFNDADTYTSMNYHPTPFNDQHPNVVDMTLLEQVIYPAGQSSKGSSGAFLSKVNNVIQNLKMNGRKDLGVPIEASNGIINHYQKNIKVDGRTISLFTHMYPLPPK